MKKYKILLVIGLVLVLVVGFATLTPFRKTIKVYFTNEQEQEKKETTGVSIAVKGSAERVSVSGKVASVLTRDRDIEVVDVSDPASPKQIKTLDTPGFGEVVYHDGENYYVGDSYELQVYKDILGKPIGTFNLRKNNFWPSAINATGGYVYLASSNRLGIFDVTNPAKIKQVSTTTITGQNSNNIFIKDGYAYVVETLGGLNIVDVRDPARAKVVKVIPFDSHTVGFDIKGDYAYLARVLSIKNGKATGSGVDFDAESILEVYNISNPENPTLAYSEKVGTMFINLQIEGNLAYISGSPPFQMTTFDISDPQKPVKKYAGPVFTGGSDFQDMAIEDGIAYFGDGATGLLIGDLKKLGQQDFQPTKVEFNGRGSHVYKKGNYVFATIEKKYASFFDVKNPDKPILGESVRYNSGYDSPNYDSTEDFVYINANGSKIFDAKDPKKPLDVQKNVLAMDSIQIEGDYLYSSIGEIGILVYDISNRADPKLVTTKPLTGQARDLSVDGKWGLATSNLPYSVQLIDLSDPKNPLPKGNYVVDDYQETSVVKNGYVYVPRQDKGLDILKIEDQGTLTLVKNLPGEKYAHHAAVAGNRLYVLRGNLEVFDITDPKNPRLIETMKTRGEPIRVETDGKYLYIADGLAGLTVIKIDK